MIPRCLTFAAATLLMGTLSGSAWAAVPDPSQCTMPTAVTVGNGKCCFDIIVRDFSRNPIAGSTVFLSFGCAYGPASMLTNSAGRVHFCLVGSLPASCTASVSADGVPLANLPAENCMLVNEVLPRPGAGRAEYYELLNDSNVAIDISHWYVTSNALVDSVAPVIVPPGGYYVDSVFTNTGLDGFLSDTAAVVQLHKVGTGTIVDRVGYGDNGGAPIHQPIPTSVSTARLPNGTDTNVDGSDFNVTTQTTIAQPNTGTSADSTLGTSVYIASVYMHSTDGHDAVRLYNPHVPGGAPIDFTGCWLTNGSGSLQVQLLPPNIATVLQPQQTMWIHQWQFGFDITYNTCLRLFDPTGLVPLEYIGWTKLPANDPDMCVTRSPLLSDGRHDGTTLDASGVTYQTCTITAAPEARARSTASFAGAAPTPSAAGAVLVFTLPTMAGHGTQSVRIEILDVAGREVGSLFVPNLGPGEHRVALPPADVTGTPLAPGVYMARLEVGGQKLVKRIVMIR